jgi:hypothetical protein
VEVYKIPFQPIAGWVALPIIPDMASSLQKEDLRDHMSKNSQRKKE